MPYQTSIEIAKEKMLQAERELENYLDSADYDPEQARQLINAAEVARDEYISEVARLYAIR